MATRPLRLIKAEPRRQQRRKRRCKWLVLHLHPFLREGEGTAVWAPGPGSEVAAVG